MKDIAHFEKLGLQGLKDMPMGLSFQSFYNEERRGFVVHYSEPLLTANSYHTVSFDYDPTAKLSMSELHNLEHFLNFYIAPAMQEILNSIKIIKNAQKPKKG